MKKIIVFIGFILLAGCSTTNPPDAPVVKGEWKKLNTSLMDLNFK